MLGAMYYIGDEISQDHNKALKLFKKSCELGDQGSCGIYKELYDNMRK